MNSHDTSLYEISEARIASWIEMAERNYANPKCGRDMNDAKYWHIATPEAKREWAIRNLRPLDGFERRAIAKMTDSGTDVNGISRHDPFRASRTSLKIERGS